MIEWRKRPLESSDPSLPIAKNCKTTDERTNDWWKENLLHLDGSLSVSVEILAKQSRTLDSSCEEASQTVITNSELLTKGNSTDNEVLVSHEEASCLSFDDSVNCGHVRDCCYYPQDRRTSSCRSAPLEDQSDYSEACSFSFAIKENNAQPHENVDGDELQFSVTDQATVSSNSDRCGSENELAFEETQSRVRIGRCFQADIPPMIRPQKIDSEHDLDSYRWLGSQVWPLKKRPTTLVTEERRKIGKGRPKCCPCLLRGSPDCIRQHILKERQILKSELSEAFYSWGFDKMGEVVSDEWTLDEEATFRRVVRMNASFQNQTFWGDLKVAFPMRGLKELVSYYFNVFMLRRRIAQNRIDPDNVDSDDDETELCIDDDDDDDDDDNNNGFESDQEVAAKADLDSSNKSDELLKDNDDRNQLAEEDGSDIMPVSPFSCSLSDWLDISNSGDEEVQCNPIYHNFCFSPRHSSLFEPFPGSYDLIPSFGFEDIEFPLFHIQK